MSNNNKLLGAQAAAALASISGTNTVVQGPGVSIRTKTVEEWEEYFNRLEQIHPEARAALEKRSTKLYKALK